MTAPNLDLSNFMSKVVKTDLARPNLYSVIFGSLNNSIQETGGLTPFSNLGNRLLNVGDDILRSQSQLYRTITGAASQLNIVRGVFGSDYFDFLGSEFDAERDIPAMVKSVNIPGMQLETTQNRFRRDPQHVINNMTRENVTMTLYLTPEHHERIWMEMWIRMIYDSNRSQVALQSMYARPIEIYTYDRSGIAMSKTTLINAFPIRIGSVQLDSEMNNQVSTVEVEFVYERYSTKVLEASERNTGDIVSQVQSFGRTGRILF